MSSEVEKLEEEIEILKKRINILEKRENRRKALGYIKILEKIIVITLVVVAIWKGYDYVVNGIPKLIENKVSDLNPFKKNG